jgi:hypothetical protein
LKAEKKAKDKEAKLAELQKVNKCRLVWLFYIFGKWFTFMMIFMGEGS